MVVGSNINIEQNNRDKNKKDAVVAIGSRLKLKNAKSSIVIGAVDEELKRLTSTEEATTIVEDASWAVVLGIRRTLSKVRTSWRWGNNIKVNENNNDSLIILGNLAKQVSQ